MLFFFCIIWQFSSVSHTRQLCICWLKHKLEQILWMTIYKYVSKNLKNKLPMFDSIIISTNLSVEINRICKMHLKISRINQVKKVYKVKENTWCYTMDTWQIFRTDKELKTFSTRKKSNQWANEISRLVSKYEICRNKHVKNCSIYLAITEMPIKWYWNSILRQF